ncbi:hypothetical protein MKQ68_13290 [Chitinophaga horti]|uniref:Uncharacterized protein n=1 Tax=Chitinophaga horti TaxID=2920382 RepID=A0ABY6IYS7_9BACT|nr:hypothetical protein [Chitinophaga horti]UYQ91067.1 hypothetical protein MKQ68_13290 [Chitinophaga horti]
MKENQPNTARQWILLIPAMVLALLVYNMPLVKQWFQDRPVNYYKEFKSTLEADVTEDQMREIRYGKQYVLANMLLQTLAKEKDVTVLLEPNSYYRENGIDIIVPEPVVFYYYTNGKMKAVWTNSKDIYKAKFFVRISKTMDLSVVPLNSKADIDKVLADYKNYNATL